jgi:methionine sulfoxide reductase catalytic subunit
LSRDGAGQDEELVMLVRSKKNWEIPESQATPESVYTDRRALLKAMGYGALLATAAGAAPFAPSLAADAAPADPSATLYPFKRNDTYKLDRPITDAKYSTDYNNFYEFSTDKELVDLAQKLPIRPWTVAVDGMVEKPFEIGIDDLMKKMALEERLYRHRCVEAWSMAVPWSGFALKEFVAMCKPLSSATYLKMITFMNADVAPGQGALFYPWPYVEGLTMAEATNELSFLVTGMYGKPVPKQDGAPLRLAVPWKYGFKSVKSIVKFTFTDKQPRTFWQDLQESEYGFWANVNPEVPHPRWSQATERVIGTDDRVPTLMWNGYGDHVAHLYDKLKEERLFA